MSVARKVIEETLNGVPTPQHFLVVSSVDVVLAGRHLKKMERRRVWRPSVDAFDLVKLVCNTYSRHGVDEAKALVTRAVSDPLVVWWCDSMDEYQEVLTGIYSRLLASSHPADAFDHGSCGSLAWIRIWPDR